MVRLLLAMAGCIAMFFGGGMVGAQDIGAVRYACRSPSAPTQSWVFSLDYDRHTVAIDAPVNWVWFTPRYVLFLHTAFVNGRHYLTQSYTLERATGAFEACDYASGADQPSPCDATFRCRSDAASAAALMAP